ncbi:hypothetical protein DAPPUDRAFT_234315 [Daphnia pulex]|uniref:Uncharacterized protein n=1 Tax=Daphnia pulex TaxID=6669 RepID=E9FWB4_DAPPU|nr:hypothetical protein DAPPUDRAFT_234315 [Daphnia pulex]|eukprot:EFX87862.1 hypothetical protein DAPPUDRAFT_234315 [Daphnia pulex]
MTHVGIVIPSSLLKHDFVTGLCFPEAMVRTEEGRWRGKKRPDGEDRRGSMA